jgi:hypothetical protein
MRIKVIINNTNHFDEDLVEICMNSFVPHGTWWFIVNEEKRTMMDVCPFPVDGHNSIEVVDPNGAPEDLSDWLLDFGRLSVLKEYQRLNNV